MNVRQFLRIARRQGWEVEPLRGGHLRLRHPEAERFVIMAASPSCRRAYANVQSEMRRALRQSPTNRGEP